MTISKFRNEWRDFEKLTVRSSSSSRSRSSTLSERVAVMVARLGCEERVVVHRAELCGDCRNLLYVLHL